MDTTNNKKKKWKKRKKKKNARPITESSYQIRKDGQLISKIHNLMKMMDKVKSDTSISSAEQRTKLSDLKKTLIECGGFQAYQTASKLGEEHHGQQNTSKWILKQMNKLTIRPSTKDERLKLLDVGALQDNYVNQKSWIDCTAIDINPCDQSVQKADFLTFTESKKFEVIILSLVINFIGNAAERGIQQITFK
ncbi:uncharacterized protein TRIADDRAFT_56862 [Trichoplax adhaerens]|uniref:Uncharacterized protein n=1 Tax=Trichoplax adhaerens TaxID=10228 RepID=B3RWS7_TRIAD|nr:hypothetical protein TRIADDRAFT_56862 [Trichoplax adhaerens]EDV25178.1 hypothetical protein TRIADDRAFT_56862 [Trichoplax adhaerens]|eukprot:XP_002113068.1 hypothetical protein TRIADDRAFT_56862 [Trichoplax adhaerens]